MIAWRKHPAGMRPVSNRAYPFAEHVLVDAERWIISKGLIEYLHLYHKGIETVEISIEK